MRILDGILWIIIGSCLAWYGVIYIAVEQSIGVELFGTPLSIWMLDSIVPISWGMCALKAIWNIWDEIVNWPKR